MTPDAPTLRGCGMPEELVPALPCRGCGRDREQGPLPECRRRVLEDHMALVHRVAERAVSRSQRLAGEDDMRAGLLHVLRHAVLMLGHLAPATTPAAASPTPAPAPLPTTPTDPRASRSGLIWFD